MKKHQLGTSGIYISELTLGGMSLGTDQKKAKEIIDAALDRGINHLDTADLYDFGRNEEIIGEIIKGKRQDIILTTKAGNHFSKKTKDWFWDPSKEYILSAVKKSLKRLQTDYLDFFMLHGRTIDDPMDETIEAMEELKAAGLIRAYGISSIRPNVIESYIKKSAIDGVMMQYSLLDRRPEESLLDRLNDHGISVITRGSLAKGIFSAYSEENIRKKAKDGYLDYKQYELIQTIHQIKEAALGIPLSEAALRYVLQHPAITTVTLGASTRDQILENTAINLDHPLPENIYQSLQSITRANRYTEHRR